LGNRNNFVKYKFDEIIVWWNIYENNRYDWVIVVRIYNNAVSLILNNKYDISREIQGEAELHKEGWCEGSDTWDNIEGIENNR
jgi:hypothetical protein